MCDGVYGVFSLVVPNLYPTPPIFRRCRWSYLDWGKSIEGIGLLKSSNYRYVRDVIQKEIIQLGIDSKNYGSKRDELLRKVSYQIRDYGLELYGKAARNPYATSRSLDYVSIDIRILNNKVEEFVDEALLEISETDSIAYDLDYWVGNLQGKWVPLAPKPRPAREDMTPRVAEDYCCEFLKFYGAEGADVTRYSQDGGVDVVANYYAAQVKHQKSPIGVKVVRETFAVAVSLKKIGVVMGKSGFTADAISFAEDNGVLLFSYYPKHLGHTKESGRVLISGFTNK